MPIPAKKGGCSFNTSSPVYYRTLMYASVAWQLVTSNVHDDCFNSYVLYSANNIDTCTLDQTEVFTNGAWASDPLTVPAKYYNVELQTNLEFSFHEFAYWDSKRKFELSCTDTNRPMSGTSDPFIVDFTQKSCSNPTLSSRLFIALINSNNTNVANKMYYPPFTTEDFLITGCVIQDIVARNDSFVSQVWTSLFWSQFLVNYTLDTSIAVALHTTTADCMIWKYDRYVASTASVNFQVVATLDEVDCTRTMMMQNRDRQYYGFATLPSYVTDRLINIWVKENYETPLYDSTAPTLCDPIKIELIDVVTGLLLPFPSQVNSTQIGILVNTTSPSYYGQFQVRITVRKLTGIDYMYTSYQWLYVCTSQIGPYVPQQSVIPASTIQLLTGTTAPTWTVTMNTLNNLTIESSCYLIENVTLVDPVTNLSVIGTEFSRAKLSVRQFTFTRIAPLNNVEIIDENYKFLVTRYGGGQYFDNQNTTYNFKTQCSSAGTILKPPYLNNTVFWVPKGSASLTKVSFGIADLNWIGGCYLANVSLDANSTNFLTLAFSSGPNVLDFNQSFEVMPLAWNFNLDQRLDFWVTYDLPDAQGLSISLKFVMFLGCPPDEVKNYVKEINVPSLTSSTYVIDDRTPSVQMTTHWLRFISPAADCVILAQNVSNLKVNGNPTTQGYVTAMNCGAQSTCQLSVDATQEAVYTFQIESQNNLTGFSWVSSIIYTVNFICDGSLMFSSVTDFSREIYHSEVLGTNYSFNYFTSSARNCLINPLTSYTFSNNSNLPQAWPLNVFSTAKLGLKVSTVIDSLNDPGIYQMWVYAKFRTLSAFSPVIVFTIKCNGNTTEIYEQFSQVKGFSQEVNRGLSLTYFELPTYFTNFAFCYIKKLTVVENNALVLQNNPYRAGQIVSPANIFADGIYKFRVKVEVVHDRAVQTLPRQLTYTLVVGCTEFIKWIEDSRFMSSLSIHANNPERQKYIVYPPSTKSVQYCPVTGWRIISQKINNVLLTEAMSFLTPSSNCTSWTTCDSWDIKLAPPNSTMNFVVQFYISDVLSHFQETIIEVKKCTQSSTLITPLMNSSYTKTFNQFESKSDIILPGFECSFSQCCSSAQIMQILTLSNQDPFKLIPMSFDKFFKDSSTVKLMVPTNTVKNYTFYLMADNFYGARAISPKIEISVLRGKSLNFSTLELQKSENSSATLNKSVTVMTWSEFYNQVKEFRKQFLKSGQLSEEWKLPINDWKETNPKYFKSRISLIRRNSEVVIEFNTEVKDTNNGVQISQVNKEVLELQILSSDETRQKSSIKNTTDLEQLDWKPVSLKDNLLVIQMKLKHPEQFSQTLGIDLLGIHVKDPNFFIDSTGTKLLSSSSYFMKKVLTKQLLNNIPSDTLKGLKVSLKNGVDSIVFTKILFNFVISYSIGNMSDMLYVLTLIAYHFMMILDYPANVQYINEIVFYLINAEMLDPAWTTRQIFDFDKDEFYVEYAREVGYPMFLTQQVYDAGFESFNPVLNMGGIYSMLVLTAAHLVFIFLMKQIVLIHKTYTKAKRLKSLQVQEGGEIRTEEVYRSTDIRIVKEKVEKEENPLIESARNKEGSFVRTSLNMTSPKLENGQDGIVKETKEQILAETNNQKEDSEVVEIQPVETIEEPIPNNGRIPGTSLKSRCKRFWNQQYYGAFFKNTIDILRESFMQTTAASILFFNTPHDLLGQYDKSDPKALLNNKVMCYSLLVLNLGLQPLFAIFLIFISSEYLIQEKSKIRKYLGTFYEDLKLNEKKTKMYLLLMFLRRIGMVFLIFNWRDPDSKGIQVITIMLINTFFLIFVGQFQPYSTFQKNRKSMLQETFILFVTDLFVVYTDFVLDYKDQYVLGWIYVMAICGFLILSLITLVSRPIYLIAKKTWYWSKMKCSKFVQFFKDEKIQESGTDQFVQLDIFKIGSENAQDELQLQAAKRLERWLKAKENALQQKQLKAFNYFKVKVHNDQRVYFLEHLDDHIEENMQFVDKVDKFTDLDKVKFLQEYIAVRKLRLQWKHMFKNQNPQIDQKESFDNYLVYFREREKNQWGEHALSQIEFSQIKEAVQNWELVRKHHVQKKKITHNLSWYVQYLNPFWFFNVSYKDEHFQKFLETKFIVKNEEMKSLYQKADKNFNEESFMWEKEFLSQIKKERVKHLTSCISSLLSDEAELKVYEKKMVLLYKLLETKADNLKQYYKTKTLKLKLNSVDEYIWDQIRLFNSQDFLPAGAQI